MDFVFGIAVGWGQTLIGHPLDTYTVWKQTNSTFPLKNLYRGITVPLACNSVYNSMLFGVYSQSYKFTENHWLSGAIAGLFGGPVLSLTDSVKIGLQTGQKSIQFRGVLVTTLLESPANSIYFGLYQFLISSNYPTYLAGGLAGLSAWASIYPLDVIKTRVQIGKSYKEAIKIGGFSKGVLTCLIRAFLTNSFGFYIYDKLIKNGDTLK